MKELTQVILFAGAVTWLLLGLTALWLSVLDDTSLTSQCLRLIFGP